MPEVPELVEPEPGPRTLVEVRWGGARLGALRGAPGRAIGESWEFSTIEDRESTALGRPLSALLGRQLAFLAKLIDTCDSLSIQVHPPADPATGWGGKEEAWVVLDAAPGAEVLAGLLPGVDRAQLEAAARAVLGGRPERALLDLLRRVPVRRGSIVLLPSGTLHSIGANVLLAEIQQPADRTCRLYDWGSGRALQVEEALAVLDPRIAAQVWQPDEAPRVLRGRHVQIEVLGPGTHRLRAARDALVIPVNGACELEVGAARARLAPGELRLSTAPELSVSVGDAGLVAVGQVSAA